MDDLKNLRSHLQSCRYYSNAGCAELNSYRDACAVPGASHPLLFQIVPLPRS